MKLTIQDIAQYFQQYGLSFSSKYFTYAFFKQYRKRHELVNEYLQNFYALGGLNQFQFAPVQRLKENDYKIWVFWWQGIENMPPIVKLCFDSLLLHAGNIPVYVLTKKNFGEYVSLPSFIMEKFQKGNFSITHFSDLLRFALLSQYGGLWLDATVFVSGDLQNHPEIFQGKFYTCKGRSEEDSFNISHHRWTGFFMGTNEKFHPIFRCGLDLFYGFWRKHDILVDYFLIDYIINYLYFHSDFIRKQIEDVPINNCDISRLNHLLNQPFDEHMFLNITNKTTFHKLSWKTKIDYTAKNSFYQELQRVIRR